MQGRIGSRRRNGTGSPNQVWSEASRAEETGIGKGCSPPRPTRESGERHQLPQWDLGRCAGRKRVFGAHSLWTTLFGLLFFIYSEFYDWSLYIWWPWFLTKLYRYYFACPQGTYAPHFVLSVLANSQLAILFVYSRDLELWPSGTKASIASQCATSNVSNKFELSTTCHSWIRSCTQQPDVWTTSDVLLEAMPWPRKGAGSYLAGMAVAIPILNVDGRRHTNNFSKKY